MLKSSNIYTLQNGTVVIHAPYTGSEDISPKSELTAIRESVENIRNSEEYKKITKERNVLVLPECNAFTLPQSNPTQTTIMIIQVFNPFDDGEPESNKYLAGLEQLINNEIEYSNEDTGFGDKIDYILMSS